MIYAKVFDGLRSLQTTMFRTCQIIKIWFNDDNKGFDDTFVYSWKKEII